MDQNTSEGNKKAVKHWLCKFPDRVKGRRQMGRLRGEGSAEVRNAPNTGHPKYPKTKSPETKTTTDGRDKSQVWSKHRRGRGEFPMF